ncbi:hypothetical protein J1N35_038658 [Gossypium stocksii]|uniref:Uncharacterized protein n=1 Tax=Gossypium stocksii TaxID=47602 RepID=A0A9D3UN57_9ROSI|nr:hypothetical protein J1N35_038658 [Gossypium stocksii]
MIGSAHFRRHRWNKNTLSYCQLLLDPTITVVIEEEAKLRALDSKIEVIGEVSTSTGPSLMTKRRTCYVMAKEFVNIVIAKEKEKSKVAIVEKANKKQKLIKETSDNSSDECKPIKNSSFDEDAPLKNVIASKVRTKHPKISIFTEQRNKKMKQACVPNLLADVARKKKKKNWFRRGIKYF